MAVLRPLLLADVKAHAEEGKNEDIPKAKTLPNIQEIQHERPFSPVTHSHIFHFPAPVGPMRTVFLDDKFNFHVRTTEMSHVLKYILSSIGTSNVSPLAPKMGRKSGFSETTLCPTGSSQRFAYKFSHKIIANKYSLKLMF